MRRDRGLREDDRLRGVDAGGEIGRGDLPGLGGKQLRVLRDCYRVQVDDAEDAGVFVLHLHELHERAEIVAEMKAA